MKNRVFCDLFALQAGFVANYRLFQDAEVFVRVVRLRSTPGFRVGLPTPLKELKIQSHQVFNFALDEPKGDIPSDSFLNMD